MSNMEVSLKDTDVFKRLLSLVNKILKDDRCPDDLKDEIVVEIKAFQMNQKERKQ